MHGKHSWRVEGPSDQNVTVAQLLSKEVVEYIRNRKPNQQRGVCFSFNYNITDVVSNGTKNKARAEIDYYDGSWHTVANDTVTPVNDCPSSLGKWPNRTAIISRVFYSLTDTTKAERSPCFKAKTAQEQGIRYIICHLLLIVYG